MFENLNPTFKTVVSAIAYHGNMRNVIFVGSFADYIHYKRYGYEPIKPKDVDIVVTSLNDLGELKYKAELAGPFDNPVYNKFLPHKQYLLNILGVKVDIYVVENLPNFTAIATEYVDYHGVGIHINTKEQAIKNQEDYIEHFDAQDKRDSENLYRLRKHSRRLSFYNMLENKLL